MRIIAVADAQAALDRNSVATAVELAGSSVEIGGEDYNLLSLGFSPTFHAFTEATVEAKLSFSMQETTGFGVKADASVGVNVGIVAVAASIDYHPTPEADAAGTGVSVPDIRQLTESAARRVLLSVGLGLEVTQGPPSVDPSCAEGPVMLQSPKAGETAPRGTRVIAIFSRKEG